MNPYEVKLKVDADGPARFTLRLQTGALTFNRAQTDENAVDFRIKPTVALKDEDAAQLEADPRFEIRKLSAEDAAVRSARRRKLSPADEAARKAERAKMGPEEAAQANG